MHHLVLKEEHSPFTVYLGLILTHCHLSDVGRVCCWVPFFGSYTCSESYSPGLQIFKKVQKIPKVRSSFLGTLSRSNWNLESWFLKRGENQGEKTLGARTRTKNKLNPGHIGGECSHRCAITTLYLKRLQILFVLLVSALNVLHLIWVREHNRIALKLKGINVNWGSDKLFFETRKILGAMMQHVTYNEYLPVILSPALV